MALKVTDWIQILSGDKFVCQDPCQILSDETGMQYPLTPGGMNEDARLQLLGFRYFLPDGWDGQPFDGTVFRLPLRVEESELAPRTVLPQEVRTLFDDFLKHEINVSMLFLQHLRSINLVLIDAQGGVTDLACCTVSVLDSLPDGSIKKAVRTHIATRDPPLLSQDWIVKAWRYDEQEALQLLKDRIPGLKKRIIEKNKLRPDVGIAFPLNAKMAIEGHLFTFLRLPIPTGFPVHLHALFALLPSRAGLRWRSEKGIVEGSQDQCVFTSSQKDISS